MGFELEDDSCPRQLQQVGPQLREHAPPLRCQAV